MLVHLQTGANDDNSHKKRAHTYTDTLFEKKYDIIPVWCNMHRDVKL